MPRPPQPLPYQGSKRAQAPAILGCLPAGVATLWEPFGGSGAVTLAAAQSGIARAHVLGDSLAPLVALWGEILGNPAALADSYATLWAAGDPRVAYDEARARFNRERAPADLLYLLARCVKAAVRFNRDGAFNQAADHRRRGAHPDRMRERLLAAHHLLAGRTRVMCADYAESLAAAGPDDVVYLDPPYVGVSGARDGRYHAGLDYDRLVATLGRARDVAYLVSFDGRCGERRYGPGLPEALGLWRIEVFTGRSSQATLHGRRDETVETLHLSPALVARLAAQGRTPPRAIRLAAYQDAVVADGVVGPEV